jgi:hypothetical protein
MLAFSNAACGAGRQIPRSRTRLSGSPPQREHPKKLIDPGGAAAAEHAAKRTKNIATGGFDGTHRQIRIIRAANMLS